MYQNKGKIKMKKKIIILHILMIFQNNKLMEGPSLSDLMKVVGVFTIPPAAAFVIYGIGYQYYYNHFAPTEKAIQKKEESLKHPDLQTEYWQNRLKKEIAELKERLKKEQEEKKKKEKQEKGTELNEQQPPQQINTFPLPAANKPDGSNNFFELNPMIPLSQNYNPFYNFAHPQKASQIEQENKIGLLEALPEGYANCRKITRLTTAQLTSRMYQFLNPFLKGGNNQNNMDTDPSWL